MVDRESGCGRSFAYPQVTFSEPLVTKIYIIPTEDRLSPWPMMARDRARFARRVEQTGVVLNDILKKHAEKSRDREEKQE